MDPKILHQKFVRLGKMRHKLKNELLALLPEIYKSGIFKKYAGSIVEYAGKYGDIAKSTVIRRLGLEKKLINKPFLKEAIKTAGLQKVAIVANLATPETDKAFADKVRNMSKSAIQTLAKELRQKQITNFCSQCHAKPENIKIELDEEMTFMFLKLKNKIGKNLSNNEIMRKILKSVTGHTLTKRGENGKTTEAEPAKSRYIPSARKRSALKQTAGRCAYPDCGKPVEIFHHTERFAENKNHESIKPLCRAHHEFMHNGLVANENQKSEKWQLDIRRKPAHAADLLYRKYRQKALFSV